MSDLFETLTKPIIDEPGSEEGALVPFLFLAFQADRPLAAPLRIALGSLDEVAVGRGASRELALAPASGGRAVTCRVADERISSRHARLARRGVGWVVEDLGSRNGTLVNGAAVASAPLRSGDIVEMGHTIFVFGDGMPADLEQPTGEISMTPARAAGLATASPALERAFVTLAAIARSDVPVLIQGETGTGKEVTARAVHELSRRAGELVPVNCGALPATLVESELFGYRKGAFSGAVDDRVGLIRSAEKGTLFLDEVGDLALSSQAALLRVLQEQEVTPVGSTRPVRVDFRLVAATHRPLAEMVERERFRSDLLNRLSGHRLELPPLRARREDLGLLIAMLLRRIAGARTDGIRFAPAAARALFLHDWPGNVRELERGLSAAVALAPDGLIRLDRLPPAPRAGAGAASGQTRPPPPASAHTTAQPLRPIDEELQELEKRRMLEALERTGGNKTKAAALLAMPLRTFQTRCRQYKIQGTEEGEP
jgi:transcriptional regulator with GAF, ATPase, and Fis domain